MEGATRTGTGKTRIKARKVLPGELPAATLSPQDVSLSSCPVIPNEDESNRKVQVQMKLNVNLPTPPSSKKQYLSGEHEPFQLTTNLTCHTTYPQVHMCNMYINMYYILSCVCNVTNQSF